MNKFGDHSPKSRLLRILLLLIERPYGYTKKQLAAKYDVHEDTVKKDFEEMRNAGFTIDIDDKYRYGLGNDKAFEYLRDMLYLTTDDETILQKALLQSGIEASRSARLLKKLEYLHDISVLGNRIFNKPFLTKIDLLEKARMQKRVVTLIDYRSTNSSKLSDRNVEAYHISQREDIVQAWDLDRKELRHFKISRISRIEITELPWKYSTKHEVMATDPFGIADKKQILVTLKLKVGGYNELVERFPLSLAYLSQAPEIEDVYIFDGMVNHRFYGLSNFLLGYFEHVIEVQPQALADHLNILYNKIKY